MANKNDSPHANWHQFDRGETQHVDYKAPLGWDSTSKPGLMKDIIAMANTRDGGRLVIGVREHPETRSFEPVGLDDEQLGSFDATAIAQYVNGFVQPAVTVRVERPIFEDKRLIVIQVEEFGDVPHVCTRSAPEEKPSFRAGDVLIRTPACQSRRISTAEEMRALLRLAMNKTSDTLLRDFRRVLEGGSPQAADAELHAQQLASWDEEFERFRKELESKREERAVFESLAIPRGPVTGLESHEAREQALQDCKVKFGYYPEFPDLRYGSTHRRAEFVAGEASIDEYESRWRLHESGLLAVVLNVPCTQPPSGREAGKYLRLNWLCAEVMSAFLCAGRLYGSLNFEGDVEVRFRWTNMYGRYLVFDQWTWQPERHVCHEPEIREKAVLRVVDLRSAWEPVAVELVTRICGLFQVEESVREAVRKRFEGIRAGRD